MTPKEELDLRKRAELLARDLYEVHGREGLAIAGAAMCMLARRIFQDPDHFSLFASSMLTLLLSTPEDIDDIFDDVVPPPDKSMN